MHAIFDIAMYLMLHTFVSGACIGSGVALTSRLEMLLLILNRPVLWMIRDAGGKTRLEFNAEF